jgi:hypothetical protein
MADTMPVAHQPDAGRELALLDLGSPRPVGRPQSLASDAAEPAELVLL